MNRVIVATEGLSATHLAVLKDRLTDVQVQWLDVEAARASISSIDVLIVKDTCVSATEWDAAERLRLVIQLDPGTADVDARLLDKPGVAYERMYWPALIGVAEHTLLMMLGLMKNFVASVERVRTNQIPAGLEPAETTQTSYAFNWTEEKGLGVLYRRVLGVVGLGWIGREVVKRAVAFGMKVLYTKPNRLSRQEEIALGVTYASFEELLQQSDVVSLHARFTPETERMIDEDALRLMKPTSILINTARGRLIDEDALIRALQDKRLAGAGLDVFWKEPVEPDNPLLSMDNVLVTPHDAGLLIDDADRLVGTYIADAIEHYVLDRGKKG